MGLGVWGWGFGEIDCGLGVWGLGLGLFGVWGLGFGIWGIGFGIQGLGVEVEVQSLVHWDSCFRFRESGLGFRVSGRGFGRGFQGSRERDDSRIEGRVDLVDPNDLLIRGGRSPSC